MQDLSAPERILLGSAQTPSAEAAVEKVASIYRHWVPEEKIIRTLTWSTELAKLVTNAMLAQRVSSINAVAAVCEATGAEVGEVAGIVGMDSRISPKFLVPSVGFGGQALTRINVLVYLAESLNLTEAALYWQSVVDVNEYSKKRFARNMISNMFNTVQRKKIAVLGFTFKANTSETRASPAIDICMHLLTERAQLHIYDPKASKEAIIGELERSAQASFKGKEAKNRPDIASLVTVESTVEAACDCAHAIAILTEWEEFKGLDYAALYGTMQRPAHIFDGRRVIDCDALRKIGFAVYQIGAGADGLGQKQ